MAGLPFHVRGAVASRSRAELGDLLTGLAQEITGAVSVVGVSTAAQLRQRYGSLPAGIREGSERLVVELKIGSDVIFLVMGRTIGRWRVQGLTR
jgi:hypothetical protein